MKKRGKIVSLQLALTMLCIALGAALHGRGIVGFWGMFTIMMIPNAAFMLMRIYEQRRSKQAL